MVNNLFLFKEFDILSFNALLDLMNHPNSFLSIFIF